MTVQDIPTRRPGVLGVHSLDHFALQVPDLDAASNFYMAFGLEVRDEAGGLGLYTEGQAHRWGSIARGAGEKRLSYLSFGAFADDIEAFEDHIAAIGVPRIQPPAGIDLGGIWIEGFDGLPINIRAGEKSSPNAKSRFESHSAGPAQRGTVLNSQAPRVHPRRLAHLALFTTDVDGAIAFYEQTLGLRLSDRGGHAVAFLHGAHGSDHHLLALVLSDHRGLHHVSWDVASVQEVGLGQAQMNKAGYTANWGLGRHVLGANYFNYIRDPWGSWSEYSADIDYIPADCDWPTGSYLPEDAMFLWGPNPPAEFIVNCEPKEA
jgi:catechol 2,3-dioxygenase-like lactoylglutathione lyase family enzyme